MKDRDELQFCHRFLSGKFLDARSPPKCSTNDLSLVRCLESDETF